ncbi:MAG: proteasome accessory factor PafA2 family protein [Syntrophobacteraceae bacterium]|nr:proteasome accessory factor PafA2 family protein [Syntrophobacteraceae bacterium]
MEERIFGTECEYALFHQLPPPSAQGSGKTAKWSGTSFSENLQEMSHLLVCALRGQNRPLAGEFLANGGRFYIDRGSHPEYATPECRSVADVIAHEKAGDRLVQKLVEEAGGLMAEKDIPGRLHAFKNNHDPRGNTYGSHENYLVSPRAMEKIQQIIPFLITRQIFAGAGKIPHLAPPAFSGEDWLPFAVSQRADFVEHVLSDRASDARGIINTRKREITRSGDNVRLHVILGDSNMSEYALKLKIGTTALVLRMIEDGLGDIPAFLQPVQALKVISRRPAGVHAVEGAGSGHTALEVQSIYLEKALGYFSSHAATGEEKAVLCLWETTLSGLKNLRISPSGVIEDDPGELSRKLDWVIKAWLLNRAREKKNLDWSDPHIKHLDFRYHDLDPETGLFERCASLGLVDRVIEEEAILLAMEAPPHNTRARLRGGIIGEAWGKDVEVLVENWESIRIIAKSKVDGMHPFARQRRSVNGLKANLNDPFEGCNEALLKRVRRFLDKCDEV